METIRLEVCIYENEYGMCVSLVLLHGVCLLSFCMECVSCPSAWSVSLVLLHGVSGGVAGGANLRTFAYLSVFSSILVIMRRNTGLPP